MREGFEFIDNSCLYNIGSWKMRTGKLFDEANKYPVIGIFSDDNTHINKCIKNSLCNNSKKIISVQLGESDNNEQNFWRTLTQSLSGIYGHITPHIERMGFPMSTFQLDMYSKIIKKNVTDICEYCIIFNNMDAINNNDIIEFIFSMAEIIFKGSNIVMIYPDACENDFSEKVINGIFFPITQSDIGFTFEEFEEYIDKWKLEELDIDTIKSLYALYSSRPTLLLLIWEHLSSGNKIYDLNTMTINRILEYIIWNNLDEETQQICFSVHCLKSFSSNVWCNLFSKSLSDFELFLKNVQCVYKVIGTDTYAFDGFFEKFLYSKINITSSIFIPSCSLSADYLFNKGDLIDAALLYFICSNYDGLFATLERIFKKGVRYCGYRWLYSIIDRVPDVNIKTNIKIQIIRIALDIIYIDPNQAKKKLDTLMYENRQQFDEDSYLMGEAYTLFGIIGYMSYKKDMYIYFNEAYNLLPNGTVLFKSFLDSVDVIPYSFSKYFENQWEADEFYNTLKDMENVVAKVLNGNSSGMGMLLNAQIMFLRNDMEKSKAYISMCKDMAKEYKQHILILEANFLLVQICLKTGDGSKANSLIKVMRKYAESLYYPKIMERLSLMESYYYIKIGDISKVPTWVKKARFHIEEDIGDTEWMMHYVHAEYLMKLEKFYELGIYLNKLEQVLMKKNNYSIESHIRFYIVASITFMKNSKILDAVSCFEKAYDISRKNNIVFPFIERGSNLLKLLNYIVEEEYIDINSEWLAYICENTKIYEEIEQAEIGLKKIYRLTPKEMEVLHFISKGYTNAQIASYVFTTVPTVKWYAQQIYSKLGVRNRTEAARKAISAGLVEKSS